MNALSKTKTSFEMVRTVGAKVVWVDSNNNVRRGVVKEVFRSSNGEMIRVADENGLCSTPNVERVGFESNW